MSSHLLKEKKLLLTDYVIFVSFIILSLIGLLFHEMSETEMQNWVVAKESDTLQNFWYNMRYEPHPYLWHTVLFLVSKIYSHYLVAQLLHLIINATAIFLIFKYSPFPKIYNWVFAFGYFPFYEYNLITRNYALCFLFIILFVSAFKHRHNRYVTLFIIAALLANTHLYGLVLSVFFVTLTIIDYHFKKEAVPVRQKRKLLIGVSCYLVVTVATAYYTRLPDDSILNTDLNHLFSLGRMGEAILGIWKSMLPVPQFIENGFWNTNYFSSIYPAFFALLSVILYAYLLSVFNKKPFALGLFLASSLSFIFLFLISKTQEMRHFGFFFLSFFVSLWIASFYEESTFLTRGRVSSYIEQYIKKLNKPLLKLLLLIQLFSGVLFYIYDLSMPFSQAKNVTHYLKEEGLLNELIAVDRYHTIPALTGYLNKSVYCLLTEKDEKFLIWNNEKKKVLNEEELLKAFDRLSTKHSGDFVVILNYILLASEDVSIANSKFKIHLLRKFEGSMCSYENFYAYTVSKQ
jgi:hypothetical protein